MSILQELNHREIGQIMLVAAERAVPVAITVRQGDRWGNLQSRAAGLRNDCLLLEMPMGPQGNLHEFSTGESVGVSLKLKHHKYLFLAEVADRSPAFGRAEEGPLLVLSRPTRMQRLQRRAYVRAAVPEGCIARVAFWLGGRTNEPSGTSPDRPVWNGRVVDLSAGGFSVRTPEDSVRMLETGYLMGARLVFGVGQEALYADVCLRHMASEGSGILLGFQFLALEHSEAGRQTLRAISRKVGEFHAAAPRREGGEVDGLHPVPVASPAERPAASPVQRPAPAKT
jgi:c-di-GMP-binding flagellar brake protein YcgR